MNHFSFCSLFILYLRYWFYPIEIIKPSFISCRIKRGSIPIDTFVFDKISFNLTSLPSCSI